MAATLTCCLLAGEPPAPGADGMSYLDNGTIRIGVDLQLGGAITWLSRSGAGLAPEAGRNVVNSFDWGRQIQMSHYSGPVPFEPDGKEPMAHWAQLGWNPIQSGDAYGHRSRVVEHRNDGRELYVKCIPMQWPLENEPGECTFECWIRLEGNRAHVRSRLVNARSDRTQYAGRSQELPAVYTNGPWWKLMTYAGDQPFTGGALTQMPAVMPWTSALATENWAALVDDGGWGLGIHTPGTVQYLGGFAGQPGAGGPKDNPTGYIAPLRDEIIDHNLTYEYRYTLILDTLDGIRRYVYDHAERPTPPVWRFDRDRQGWIYRNATDAGWPIEGELHLDAMGNDPHLVGPFAFWRAEQAPKLYIEAACRLEQPQAEVFWQRHDAGFGAEQRVALKLIPDGAYHVYEVDLAASDQYRGAIVRLRFDPTPSAAPGDWLRVRSIGFQKPEAKP
jgi:hypothetical protein